jgi:CubicO group peptidase (beta-lactamase class C family)
MSSERLHGDDPLLAVAERHADGLRVAGEASAAPVFSVTKMFVSTAVLRLAECGRLRLEDPASDRVSSVTVRELLGHTAGLPDYTSSPQYHDAVSSEPARPWSIEKIAAVALGGERSARGRFRYSNLGYWLLGEFVEQLTGDPLSALLTDLVFAPAGLTDTRYPALGDGVTAEGYDTRWAGPAGAACPPADMTRFLAVLAGGALLSRASLTAMTSGTPAEADLPWRAPRYGLGVMTDRELRVLGHGGAGPGYTSAAFASLDGSRCAAAIAGPGSRSDPTTVVLNLLAAQPTRPD